MKQMKKLLIYLLAAGLPALATTVIPPNFGELVGEAQTIFQGTVTNIRSQWIGEGAQRHIATYVTFKVEDALKGEPGSQITLRMLGGTVGNDTLQVTDAPKFKIGDRDILFVQNNGSQFVPLVGIMHGRIRVQKDENGRDAVFTHDGAPLSSVADVGTETAPRGKPLSLDQFKQAVRAQTSQHPIP